MGDDKQGRARQRNEKRREKERVYGLGPLREIPTHFLRGAKQIWREG